MSSLVAFESAARHLSFKIAAEELHLSPSALSRQIQTLEAHLQTALFERLNPGLALTEAGAAYRGEVEEVLSRLRAGQSRLRADPKGPLRVSALESFSARWLIPHLPEFEMRHPEVSLEIEATLRYADFERDAVDVAIRFGSGPWEGLHGEPLVDMRVFPVCKPGLIVATDSSGSRSGSGSAPASASAEDLAGQTLIHVSQIPSAWKQWLTEAGQGDLKAARDITYDHVGIALSAAESGQGVALSTRFLCAAELRSGRLVIPIDREMVSEETYHLVCKEESLLDPRVIAFRDWLVESLSTSVAETA